MTETLFDVPAILGMMRLLDHEELCRPKQLAGWIERRVEEGLTLFDHADIYGDNRCEQLFGEALTQAPELKSQVRLITKAGIVPAARDPSPWQVKHYNTEADVLQRALEASLKRLRVEAVDCFLIHRPDPLLPIDATARALEAMIAAGKVRSVGVSNFLPSQWQALAAELKVPLACNQIELSLLHSEPLFDGQQEAMSQAGIRPLAWSPLAGGRIAEDKLAHALAAVARHYDSTPTTIALAWLHRLPCRAVPVIGSFNEQRIREARQAAELKLSRESWFALLEAARGYRVA